MIKEEDIISALKNGDYKQFGHLVRAYQSPLFCFINRMIWNREDALDLTQETFFKAYRSIKSFKFRSKFSTWLFKIGYNESVNFIKRNKRRFETEKNAAQAFIRQEDVVIPFEKKEISINIEMTLDKLKNEQKIALHLLYREDKSYNEIAEIMEIPINTVKSHIRRGKDAFKQILIESYDPETILT